MVSDYIPAPHFPACTDLNTEDVVQGEKFVSVSIPVTSRGRGGAGASFLRPSFHRRERVWLERDNGTWIVGPFDEADSRY